MHLIVHILDRAKLQALFCNEVDTALVMIAPMFYITTSLSLWTNIMNQP